MSNEITSLPLSAIIAGGNDRTTFDPRALSELAESIKANGLIQPVTVRPLAVDGEPLEMWQIVAGERRSRACRLLGWEEVPCIVADLTDEEAAAIMLAENVGRADLDPIDEGRAYSARINGFGWTVEECALGAGVSPVRIQFRLKLLKLREDIQGLIRSGNLPLGYAQVLSDGNLDANRQLMALAVLRENPNPAPAWFRKQVQRLATEQAAEALFDGADFALTSDAPATAPKAAPTEPPTPETTTAPTVGSTPAAILAGQADFWTAAAEQWEALGKPFKRAECLAAATALRAALAAISG